MEVMELLTQAVEQNAADIFLVPGMPFSYKIGGRIICQGEEKIMPDQMNQMITRIYEIAKNRSMERVLSHGDDDFSFAIPGVSRFRANVFRQRGSLAAVIRVVRFELPDPGQLKLPEVIMGISKLTRGMVLVTGSAGSGKSTTLACIIDEINKTRNAHVITLEDPIEYLHRHKKSVVTQREVATDTDSYVSGLRASLRQAPDVILIGEMRTPETIETALVAAETGHLVFSTIHTNSAVDSIDRIVGVFPENKQPQIRLQLSMTLKAVLAQQLVPRATGRGRAAACELMMITPPVRNLIRDGRTPQMQSYLMSGGKDGSVTMDRFLAELAGKGVIMPETAMEAADDPEEMRKNFMFR